jgi:hypothetical protein
VCIDVLPLGCWIGAKLRARAFERLNAPLPIDFRRPVDGKGVPRRCHVEEHVAFGRGARALRHLTTFIGARAVFIGVLHGISTRPKNARIRHSFRSLRDQQTSCTAAKARPLLTYWSSPDGRRNFLPHSQLPARFCTWS